MKISVIFFSSIFSSSIRKSFIEPRNLNALSTSHSKVHQYNAEQKREVKPIIERRGFDLEGISSFFNEAKNKANEEWNKLKDSDGINKFKDNASDGFNKAKEYVNNNALKTINDNLGDSFIDVVNNLSNGIQKFIPEDSNQELVSDEDSIADAKHYMYMAGASYLSSNDLGKWKCDKYKNTLKYLEEIQNNDPKLRAVILEDTIKKELIISFRGAEDKSTVAALTKLDKVKYNDDDTHVHKKSMEYLNIILPVIFSKLNNKMESFRNNRIILVGHSLGGALALLAAPKIQQEFNLDYSKMAVYTYNQLKAGDSKFATWIDSLPMKVLRVVDSRDIVSKYPFIGDWAHTKRVIRLDEKTNKLTEPNYTKLQKRDTNEATDQKAIHSKLWGVYLGRNQCIN